MREGWLDDREVRLQARMRNATPNKELPSLPLCVSPIHTPEAAINPSSEDEKGRTKHR